jgi:hypothetical protein
LALRRLSFLCIALLMLAGCGSGSGTSSTPTGAEGKRYFGDHPGQEASKAAISSADCESLKRESEAEIGTPLRTEVEPTPPSSRCLLRGGRAHVSIYLDAAYAARQRYYNRMVEQDQFYGTDPSKHPHPVPGVGDPGAYGHTASWIPALSTLYAVRGNRWLTVAYSVPGSSRPQRREAAADLARSAFRLTAG